MVVIISPQSIHLGVINSQLLKIAKYISVNTKTVVCLYGREEDYMGQISIEGNLYEVIYYTKFNDLYPHLNKAEFVYIRHISFLARIVSLKFFRNKRLKLLYDFRGLLFKESWYRKPRIFNLIVLYILEFTAYHFADTICAVSNNLSEQLHRYFYNKKIFVLPCAIEKAIKRKSKLETEPIKFVYSGSLSKWQCFEEALLFYKEVSKKLECQLNIFTPDVNKAKEICESMEIEATCIVKLSQDEVIERLKDQDFGFILRENLFLNKVASPIKFLEYTSCGVIPIVTDYVGDYSDDVIELNLGYVYRIGEKVDEKRILTLLKDNLIHERLYNYSKKFEWQKLMSNYPLNR